MVSAVNQTNLYAVDEPRSRLRHWLRLDPARLLWPSRCLACEAPGLDGIDLCAACATTLPWNRCACPCCAIPLPATALCGQCLRRDAVLARRGRHAPLGAVHAACVYAAPIDRLLPRFKFHGDLAAGALLAQLMAAAFASLPRPEVVIPLPLHRARLRRRGYDQALELARPLARALDLPLRDDLLHRVRATAPQSELSAAARHRNLRHAFAVRDTAVPPMHVVLIDDVMTTGATLRAAAEALQRAGVARVDAWVAARVP
jgi:ComF family protein